MNQITSPHLPRAKALVAAFRDSRMNDANGAPLAALAEAARQCSPIGWPVTRAELAEQLRQRLNGGSLPDQQGTSYCGCAAFLYCLLEDRPDWYVAYATALWRGEPFSFASPSDRLNIRVGVSARDSLKSILTGTSPARKMSALDWMTMACLSGATGRRGETLTLTKPGDDFRAITWPYMVRRWFACVGAPARLDSVGIGLNLKSLDDLMQLFACWDSCWLVLQIDSSMLDGGGTSIRQRHWVVVDTETRPLIGQAGQSTGLPASQWMAQRQKRARASVLGQREAYGAAAAVNVELERQRVDADTALLKLRLVTWNNEHHRVKEPTLKFVLDRFYGGYAFPRFNRR